jgi:hypothetical protein
MNDLDQYMTPTWAARELFGAHFAHLPAGSIGIEPTCGDGRWLEVVPEQLDVFGVEIDPALADEARRRSGQRVITGDFFEVELPQHLDFAFGNPPFKARFMDKMLKRLTDPMEDGALCGFIVPAYFVQTDNRVLRWNRAWTISTEILPRTLFPRLRHPLVFALFTKDPQPTLRGLRLFPESDFVRSMRAGARDCMEQGRGTWRSVVEWALRTLGGEAHVSHIYEQLLCRRPTTNQWWREKVRQTLQRYPTFEPRGRGVWALAS